MITISSSILKTVLTINDIWQAQSYLETDFLTITNKHNTQHKLRIIETANRTLQKTSTLNRPIDKYNPNVHFHKIARYIGIHIQFTQTFFKVRTPLF
jgi:hypothetical protein